jgi:hypothetical protein
LYVPLGNQAVLEYRVTRWNCNLIWFLK